jgi:uncharacterized protein YwgA
MDENEIASEYVNRIINSDKDNKEFEINLIISEIRSEYPEKSRLIISEIIDRLEALERKKQFQRRRVFAQDNESYLDYIDFPTKAAEGQKSQEGQGNG